MSTFKAIRERLQLTQASIAAPLGVTQGSISFYEKGKTIPPAVAAKLIAFARKRGVALTFDEIYATDTRVARRAGDRRRQPEKSGA